MTTALAHRKEARAKVGMELADDCLLRDYDVELPWKDGTPESAYETERAAA